MSNNMNNTDITDNIGPAVSITGYTAGGAGVAKPEGGSVIFVRRAVRGDVCRVNIIKETKNKREAEIGELIEPSAHRITPDCPVFGICGGCAYRHIDYGEELYAKRERVEDALRRIGGFVRFIDFAKSRRFAKFGGFGGLFGLGEFDESDVEPFVKVLRAGRIAGYRNKTVFSAALRGGKAVTGFNIPGSHDVVAADECLLADAGANAAARAAREWIDESGAAVYDEASGKGLIRRISARTGLGGMTVCFSINGDSVPRPDELAAKLRAACTDLSGVLLNVNRGADSGVFGNKYITLWGDASLADSLDGLSLELSPASFSQVNGEASRLLYAKVKEYAALTGDDLLLDLYCGAGALTLYLGRGAGGAIGVDSSAAAIRDARANARRNNIANVSFVRDDASRFCADGLKPACITVDPPRKGMSHEAVNKIIRLFPPRIVYISCDPSTMARDLKRMLGYRLADVCMVDMFPRTSEVESVALLIKR